MNDMMTHEPLPYRVRIRASPGIDQSPVTLEVGITAYSMLEAVLQAKLQVERDNSNCVVEAVEPDVLAYISQSRERSNADRADTLKAVEAALPDMLRRLRGPDRLASEGALKALQKTGRK